jgi:hypothetical protein
MFRRWFPGLFGLALGCGLLAGVAGQARAEDTPLPRFFYYPYYYYPHSYWPSNSPQWPEPQGFPYQRPPAYMAYPPFQEYRWHYMLFESHRYYNGSHFWLDQF